MNKERMNPREPEKDSIKADQEKEHNPFKEKKSGEEKKETPQEEAMAEQQRKETLTERD